MAKTTIPDPIEAVRPVYEKLREIRESKTVSLKPSPYLREEITGMDGELMPLKLRYYQCQGIYHLLLMRRMVLGDGTGLGKTLQAIGAMCYLWPKEQSNRVIVIAPKSALRQWAAEITRFTKGVRPVIASGSFAERERAYNAFFNSPSEEGKTRTVLLLNYHVFTRDWRQGRVQPLLPNGKINAKAPVTPGYLDQRCAAVSKDLVVIFDEATAFKNMRTKTWEVCWELSVRSSRVYGLTATLLKNKLEEGFSIYKCIHPPVFTTKTAFLDTFCTTKLQSVGRAKVPIILGYKNLDLFRARIDPFFLGRPKHAVSDELPTLTTREITFDLNPAECAKYSEALTGIFEL